MKTFLENGAIVVRVLFLLICMLYVCAGHTSVHGQDVDSVEAEKIGRVDDHLRNTDRTVEDNKAEMKVLQGQFRDLEAQVNEWKGAEDVWLKIISILAGGGIVLQVSGKLVSKAKEKTTP